MEKNSLKAWLYLLPAIIFLGVFLVYPLIDVLIYSFEEGFNFAAQDFMGYGTYNYSYVLRDPYFIAALRNTLILVFITVPVSTGLALLISLGLSSIEKLRNLFQTVYFLPYVTNSIAIGIVFAAMFTMSTVKNNGETIIVTAGIINDIIGVFGVKPIDWLGPQSTYAQNMFVMVVYIVWNALPFKILILLGGLQSVNKQYYDAAKVDGTSKVRTFTRITVPLLSPMIAYVIITGFIGGFKEYTSIVGVFGESMGPTGDAYRLNTMVGYIYKYITQHQGRASAAALILFGIIFVVTLINLKVSSKKTQY